MRIAKIYFIISFLFFFVDAGTSFSQVPEAAIEFSAGIGKVIRNHPDFPDLQEPAYNGCINYSEHYKGQAPWHRYYNYPRLGISLNGGALGNKAILGYYTGVMAEMTFEKKLGANWFWAPRLSLGLAWFSQPYNEQSNPENVVIGSEFTFLAGAEVVAGRKLSPGMDIIGKAGLIHASNSHFKLPNVGMNMPVISLGFRYSWPPAGKEKTDPLAGDTVKLKTFKKVRPHARVALGVNEFGSSTTPVNGPKYPVFLASVYVSKMFSPVNKVTAGLEAWYNKGSYDFIVSQEFYDEDRHEKSCAAAIVLGHEFLMGHFGLITTAGIYLYNPFYKDRQESNEIKGFKDQLKSIIPARLGMQYYFKNTCFRENRNIFVGIYIKTNFGQADFLESGFGYMF